jgi:hypothetical protein
LIWPPWRCSGFSFEENRNLGAVFEWAVKRSLFGFVKTGINDAALLRSVLVIGVGKFGAVNHQLGDDNSSFANCPDLYKVAVN